ALYAQFPLTALALLVQWRWPQLPVEMLAMALAFLLLMLVVQRLDDSVDIFTGLRNYVTYTEDMKRNFITGKCVGVILVNISNYESLFSMLGFDLQAEMLKQISHRLSEINSRFRCHADLYYLDRARYRLVFNTKYKEKAEKAAEAINRELKQGMVLDQFELDLLAFVSVMNCPEDIPNFKSLMRFGNEFSKLNHYTGRVMHFSDIVANNRFSLTNELDIIIENALLEKKFEIYYQPIYSVKENYFASAEALLRLKDEQYGSISPSDFIPAAEKSGAIHRIGDYVMEEVCRFVSSEEFKELNLEYIEVNLSVVQCMQIGMAERILRIMEKYQVPPERINLEITETAAGYAQNSMMENMDKLSGAGIAFSLDDYGIGYSNIKRVVSLPLKMIKLDKAFVDEKENPKMWVVLQNTIKMIREMEMQIVVEGVETEELVQQFTDMDCDYIQGYYYSKPIPKLEFIEFIRREHAK
ncbi:MAG: EAL domain-containing protein, partial [Lachnospiraceae bacterium]|nr:EAL domain-containing protein [Lachnospiraceae bacterium]